jgi:hypothetical protein
MGTSLGGVGSQGTAQGATDLSSSQVFPMPGVNDAVTDILGYGTGLKLLTPKSQAGFLKVARTAFEHCATNLRPEACYDLGTEGPFWLPGMYLRELDQSAGYIVQSPRDAEHQTQNGLQIRQTQSGYAVSYDGRPVDWQSP